MPAPFNSIDELVAASNSEDFDIKSLFPDNEEEEVEEVDSEEVEEETETADEESDEESEEATEEKAEPEKEEIVKDNEAFIKMRQEIAELKKKTVEVKEDPILVKMALRYGYTDVEKFKKDFQESEIEKEAKSQGVNPDHYKKTLAAEERIAQLEAKDAENQKAIKIMSFKSTMDSVLKDTGLPAEMEAEFLNRLEAKGYDLERLLDTPDFEYLIRGALSDKILEISKQKELQKEMKKKEVSDEPFEEKAAGTKFDIDKFVSGMAKDLLS
jgi:hypothetical protein